MNELIAVVYSIVRGIVTQLTNAVTSINSNTNTARDNINATTNAARDNVKAHVTAAQVAVKSVQRGQATIVPDGTSVTINVSAVNMSKAVVTLDGWSVAVNVASAPYANVFPRIVLINSSQIQVLRLGGAQTPTITVAWQLVEYY